MNIWRILILLMMAITSAYALPPKFVYLHDVDPTIVQEMRYAGTHNFIGHPIRGYSANACILTQDTALALAKVQQSLRKSSLSLKVYDCYRPTTAVAEFIAWSKNINDQRMKDEFYPRVNKADFFKLGYVAEKSGHSRGSTVDLTIIGMPASTQDVYHPGQKLIACFAPYSIRFHDNTLDMGTGYDCMDELSHAENPNVSATAKTNRMRLRELMLANGFKPYAEEWWHFTLSNEPFPDTYFDFPIA